jgi:hypothetical protein
MQPFAVRIKSTQVGLAVHLAAPASRRVAHGAATDPIYCTKIVLAPAKSARRGLIHGARAGFDGAHPARH